MSSIESPICRILDENGQKLEDVYFKASCMSSTVLLESRSRLQPCAKLLVDKTLFALSFVVTHLGATKAWPRSRAVMWQDETGFPAVYVAGSGQAQ